MTQLEGLVQHVETQPAQSFATAAAAISDTVVYVAQIAPFLTESGTCTIDIAGVEYTATPDTDTDSLTVSPTLSVAVDEGDLITLSPAAEIKWAFVVFDGDDSGDWMQCRVPHELVGYVKFEDGPRELDAREAVLVETEPEPRIVTMVNQPTSIDATTTPIVVTNAAGESAQVDADGFTTRTNDPVSIRTIYGSFYRVATDGVSVFALDGESPTLRIRKFNIATGVESTTGFPKTGNWSSNFCELDGFLYVEDQATGDIRKFNTATGAETIGGGFPIAASGFYSIDGDADNGVLYGIDGAGDIRKYSASTGAETVGGGWPIAGSFVTVAAAGGYVYAAAVSGSLRKFDGTTAAEILTGFPVDSGVYAAAAAGDYVYAASGPIAKYDAATGEEITSSGWPLVSEYGEFSLFDAAGSYLAATMDEDFKPVRIYNADGDYLSTKTNATDGSARFHETNATKLKATADVNFTGPATIDNLLITWTKARKTAAQTTGTGTAETLGQSGETYGAFDGSGTSGDTAFWTESNGVFTILVDGVYDLSCWVEWASNSTGYRLIGIALNGSTTLVGDTRNAVTGQVTRQSISPAGGVALTAGDTVELLVLQNSGGNLNVNSGSWFTISRRGALAA